MSTAHKGAIVLVLGILALLPVGGQVRAAAPPTVPLAGTVKDTLGNVVAGVEILLVRLPSQAFIPTAVTHSDETGRFQVPKLLPAQYRFAALKQGYLTLIGQVEVGAESSIDMVLRPAIALDADSLPRDASWALRVPRRGMLHEIGDRPFREDDIATQVAGRGFDDTLSLELEQLFSIRADAVESDPQETEIQPSQTRMRLASSFGERGNIQLQGRREQLGATTQGDTLDSKASQEGAAVSLDLSYETSHDTRLDVSAYFNQTEYELATATTEAQTPLQHEQQTWGYDASWSKQIDATRRFAVALGFRNSSLVSPMRVDLVDRQDASLPQGAVSNRAMDASGSYQRVMNGSHDLQVDLRTQLLQRPTTALSSIPSSPAERSTWTLQADAKDTWAVSAPFSLVYGLGYKQSLMASDATLVVPRIGGNLTAGGWFLQALISYHAVTGSVGLLEATLVPFQPENSLGYEAEIQVPLARDVRLRGGVTYAPIQFDYFGYLQGAEGPGEHPLYLTDGNSAVNEHRVTLIEERGASRTYLELSNGRAEGTVVPLLPFEGPLPIVSGRELRYRNGRFGVVLPGFRTDLRVEYSRVESKSAGGGRTETDSIQESVELRVKTDVPATQIPGDWRVLLALRMGTVRSAELARSSHRAAAESVDALNRRISAGVSVLF